MIPLKISTCTDRHTYHSVLYAVHWSSGRLLPSVQQFSSLPKYESLWGWFANFARLVFGQPQCYVDSFSWLHPPPHHHHHHPTAPPILHPGQNANPPVMGQSVVRPDHHPLQQSSPLFFLIKYHNFPAKASKSRHWAVKNQLLWDDFLLFRGLRVLSLCGFSSNSCSLRHLLRNFKCLTLNWFLPHLVLDYCDIFSF